jgi:hypothetical protein
LIEGVEELMVKVYLMHAVLSVKMFNRESEALPF